MVDFCICRTLDQVFETLESEDRIPVYHGDRYVRCLDCGQVKSTHAFVHYGGRGHRLNYGHCWDCMIAASRIENFI